MSNSEGEMMNNLLIVGIMTGLIIVGFVFIMGAAATPPVKGDNTGKNTPTVQLPPIVDGKQDVFLKATKYGTYSPSALKVKKGIPVRLHFSADLGAGCGHTLIIPEYNVQESAPGSGETLIEFTPSRTGKFPFHCSMKMFNGSIEVVA